MRWNLSTQFLLAGFIDYAFASLHHYNAHSHRHRHLMRRIEQLEARGLAWDRVDNIQGDMELEYVTLTTTTTVIGNCAPTNTVTSTLTLVREDPKPTLSASEYSANSVVHESMVLEPFQAQWNQAQPHRQPIYHAQFQPRPTVPQVSRPEPTESEDITITKTQTITRTATNTVKVTVTPEPGTADPDLPEVENQEPDTTEPDITEPDIQDPDISETDKLSLADTLRSNPTEQQKAVPHRGPPKKDDGTGTVNAVLDLPSQVLPDLPVVDQILPGPNAHKPAPISWTERPPKGQFSFERFGGRTAPLGTEIHYKGNVGKPWGSNIIAVSAEEAHNYKYVAQFHGAQDKPWTVVFWNKVGPDGKMTGWYGHSALTFSIAPGETRYVAFDEDSEGAWGAAPGDALPKDQWGGYSCTWGEFTFGDRENNGWSGWDVSAIQAQIAKQHVQGMSICQADGQGCSVITPNAEKVVDAYIEEKKTRNGIGGAASPGPVRLDVLLDYRG
ncbi:uncharacterized protein N7511_002501 [Penicillium nucicola]|uniref:uncharacterized protein n=1 Tax=Penicillium nucicola TaxID=1850975 RepID=UPI0025451F8B|nr:uncharacterized protein N7511_002501 [Penicillium nucicola]KAJ5770450.1 hypothetical protein N7511_002501 [Penicillium nucicola]